MRVLEVSNFFKPLWETGGVTKVNYEISKSLVQRGHDVTVYTTDGYKSNLKIQTNQLVNVEGIKVYYFQNLFKSVIKKVNLTFPYYLPFILRKEVQNFDIIHIHEHRTLLAVCVHYYAKKYKVPYVLQSHGSVLTTLGRSNFKNFFNILFGDILRDASKVIAVSYIEVEQYTQMGVPKEKIIVIPNGIDIDSFENLPNKNTFKERYGISNKYVILYLGRLQERKGIDFLIKSYAELRNEIINVTLVLAGPDSGYKHKAELLIDELNLTNHVIFTGFIDEKYKKAAYVDADVLVYPSVFEIFGLVPFEAVMCGTPVIVCDDCGCGDFVKDSGCGCLVSYGNVSDLKDKLKRILQCNTTEKDQLLDSGISYIKSNLSWKSIVVKVESLYEDFI